MSGWSRNTAVSEGWAPAHICSTHASTEREGEQESHKNVFASDECVIFF